MIRRAALRAIFGGAVAGAAVARKAAAEASLGQGAAEAVVNGPVTGQAVLGGMQKAVDERKWKLFNAEMLPINRRREFEHLRNALLGGCPPGIASNHSWAPWFKADVAARRLMRERAEQRTFEEKLHDRIFGDGWS